MSDEVKAVSVFLFFLSLGLGTGFFLVERWTETRRDLRLFEILYRAEKLNSEFWQDQFFRATNQGPYTEQA